VVAGCQQLRRACLRLPVAGTAPAWRHPSRSGRGRRRRRRV